ncbi:MAG: phosphoribulokinase [Methyloceanibacter sp.]|uniref:phosphoribulokinase n=1 Tax=Methyloceanibacter sp. TaxID=1965321 RepID=UPI001D44753F|nr:phosphoribulokinase [Methyloceanibacter sp.]MCB1442130.1 phosphoribulokinase [Methyloceanibacter sp.]MCC0058400.1 phosphoribulokinase [Hyphomicrobiaceae bacterium]
MPERVDHPIILGIVGDSASGKTTLSAGIAQILGEEHCSVFCTDDYHCYTRKERSEAGLSALDPRANYVDILEQHLRLLRKGEPILKPVYCHQQGTLGRPRYFKPTEFVIVEGLLGYSTRAMRDCYDVKIYLDPADDLRIKWKIHRDTTKRNYRLEDVVASLERRKRDSSKFIHPQRTFADIVIRFQPPAEADGSDTDLNVRHLLRPTLPHPDFSPLFDGTGNAGLHLELARDRDGKPVDVLEINGNISDKRAERIEDLLWNLIPEAGHLRGQIGCIDVANGANGASKSHPLALTQLLVGYHAVKAAMGVRAY